MSDEEKSTVFNPDLSEQLDRRMNPMLDAIEEAGDAKALAAAFRTLVEFTRAKPPQSMRLDGGMEISVGNIADGKVE